MPAVQDVQHGSAAVVKRAKLLALEIYPPDCEATLGLEAQRWRDHNPRRFPGRLIDKCGNRAKVMVDGKPYCMKHGGAQALRILLGEAGK